MFAELIAAEGLVVPVGGPLGVIAAEGEAVPASLTALQARGTRVSATSTNASTSKIESVTPQRAASKRVIASPRAKRLAAERDIDLASVAGTGADGKVTEDDVKRAAEQSASLVSSSSASACDSPH